MDNSGDVFHWNHTLLTVYSDTNSAITRGGDTVSTSDDSGENTVDSKGRGGADGYGYKYRDVGCSPSAMSSVFSFINVRIFISNSRITTRTS